MSGHARGCRRGVQASQYLQNAKKMIDAAKAKGVDPVEGRRIISYLLDFAQPD